MDTGVTRPCRNVNRTGKCYPSARMDATHVTMAIHLKKSRIAIEKGGEKTAPEQNLLNGLSSAEVFKVSGAWQYAQRPLDFSNTACRFAFDIVIVYRFKISMALKASSRVRPVVGTTFTKRDCCSLVNASNFNFSHPLEKPSRNTSPNQPRHR